MEYIQIVLDPEHRQPVVQIIIGVHADRFMHTKTCIFFVAALPYVDSCICNVSEEDLCSKTQHFMFAHCSVADISNVMTQQSVGISKQLTMIIMTKTIEPSMKRHHECKQLLTPKYPT
jgi:hypothetical protein